MGEKEQGAARESSAPSVSEREAASGMASGREAMSGQATGRESAIGEDDWEAPVSLATGDLDGDGNGIAIGDPGVNGNIADDPAAAAINSSHSNIKNLRSGSGGTDDDGDGASRVLKSKTKSNQSNDRLGHEDDPDGAGVVQYNESDLEFRQAGDGDDPAQAAINSSHSNIKNLRSGSGGLEDDGDGAEAAEAGRIRIDSTPARISTNMTIE